MANSLIKDISELAKSVIIIITPQMSHLFETVIPDQIKNTSALTIVLKDGKYYNTTNSLNEGNSHSAEICYNLVTLHREKQSVYYII